MTGVSQQTANKLITETLDALCALHLLKRFIKFPASQDLQQKKRGFREIAGFPEVIGVINGTHIRIMRPK